MKYVSSMIFAIGLFAAANTYAALTDGLVTYYSFNGNASDISGNGNHGTVNGAMLTTDRFGNANSAFSFDGVNDYISASADILPTADRTVALWFNANSLSSLPILLGYGGGACGTSFFMGVNVSGLNSYHSSSHCNANTLNSSYTSAPVNNWYHFAITTDTSGTKMYVNGTQVGFNSNYITNTNVTGKDLSIGVATSPLGFAPYTDGNVGYFNGSIDDVRIYNRALSATEITELNTVPIPAAVWLFGSGLIGLVGIAKRKKKV